MSTSTAIGAVSKSLKTLLETEMQFGKTVTLLAPDESSSSHLRINLFLYKVQENPFLRNMNWQLKPGTADTLVPPPVSLNLFYLMTAYAPNDPSSGNSTAHELLGEAIRVFYEQAIVSNDYLESELDNAREQIKIIPSHLDLNELSQIWSTFSGPFRLSVPYEVSVVQLEQSTTQPLSKRVKQIGNLTIQAPFQVPQITNLSPRQGASGSQLTISGEHFSGWFAYVSLDGESLLEQQPLAADSFTFNLPAEVVLGFHQLQVDISHLVRTTFWVEVIP
jgi:Pvc16 N-terminal domain